MSERIRRSVSSVNSLPCSFLTLGSVSWVGAFHRCRSRRVSGDVVGAFSVDPGVALRRPDLQLDEVAGDDDLALQRDVGIATQLLVEVDPALPVEGDQHRAGRHGPLPVETQLAPIDLGHLLTGEVLEQLRRNDIDTLVGAFHQVTVLAQVGAIGRGQGHPALFVELALMRPNEHHFARHHLSTRSTCLDAGDGTDRPTLPTGRHYGPRNGPLSTISPHKNPQPSTQDLRLTTAAPRRGPRRQTRARGSGQGVWRAATRLATIVSADPV